MIFKEYHIEKILRGKKTMTRLLHKRPCRVGRRYRIQRSWYKWTDIQILITRRFRQRLGDISPQGIRKEGYSTLEGFKEAWIEINGRWDPDMVVWAYEFERAPPNSRGCWKKQAKPS